MKTSDHFWTDPPADELVQRHRIHSGGHHMTPGAASPGSPKRPGLQVRPQVSVRDTVGFGPSFFLYIV